jgi:cbb3-type cytochrome oxidase cytochrome c subunit
MPTSQVPTYLEARVAAGHAVPVVEVVSPESEVQQQAEEQANAASDKRRAAGEGGEAQGAEAVEKEEMHAVLAYMVQGLHEALVTELLEGFWTEK